MPRKLTQKRHTPAESILQWQIEAGADEAIGDEPVNRLVVPAEARRSQATPRVPPEIPAPASLGGDDKKSSISMKPTAPSEAISRARQLADKAATLEELAEAIRGFDGLSIKKTATNTVIADGNP